MIAKENHNHLLLSDFLKIPLSQIAIIVQVRINSTRLNNKCFYLCQNLPLIEHLILRLLFFLPWKIIIAVPKADEKSFSYLSLKYKISLFAGSEKDVLERYYQASVYHNLKHIVRVTGDNPLTSCSYLLETLKFHLNDKNDLSYPVGLPYGSGVEVLSQNALKRVHLSAKEPSHREHLTQYFYRNSHLFKIGVLEVKGLYYQPKLRVTIDTMDDFNQYKEWCREFWDNNKKLFHFENFLKKIKNLK